MLFQNAPPQTQVYKNSKTPISQILLIYVIGFIVLFYFGMLCGAAWLPGCDIFGWSDNFTRFILIEHHFIVGFTDATPKFIFSFEVIWLIGYMLYRTQIQHPLAGREYGDAKWGNAKTFSQYFANHDPKNEVVINFGDVPYSGQPVVVNTHNYWLAEGVYVNIDNKLTSNLNILIVGPPGTGKSFRVARPVLSQLAGAFLVTDPKGELSKQTGQFFQDNGYESLILNVESEEGMENSIHFNPFRYLHTESDIMSLSQILFKATTEPDASSDAFFEQSAETLMTDLLYLMHYTYADTDKDWKHFVELLGSTAVKADKQGRGIDLTDENGIYCRFKRANEQWKAGKFTHGVKQEDNLKGWIDIEKFYTGAQETTSSIVASLDAHCRYMKLQCVQDLLSEDDIDIINSFGYCKKSDKCPTGKRILYIVTSEDKRYFDWITSMIYSMFFEELYHVTTIDPELHERLPEHLTFLMDEFNNITLPDSFVDRLSTMRSREMSAIVIVQNLKQLKHKFPKDDMDKNLVGNMSFIDILGAPDIESCEELSKMFGKTTINKRTTGLSKGSQGSSSENEDVMEYPLFSADKMFQMNKDGPCAMVIKGSDPLFEPKVAFQNSPLLPLLTRRKPFICTKKSDDKPMIYDSSKSPCEQIPKIYYGEAAEKRVQELESKGIKVLTLTLDDIDGLDVLERHNSLIDEKEMCSPDLSKIIEKAVEEVKNAEINDVLDMNDYDGTQIFVVQRLKNSGFSLHQIKALTPLIKIDTSYDEIVMYFNKDMNPEEIESFANKFVQLRKEGK